MCNAGIATGNKVMEDKQKMFSTFYAGEANGEANWSDEDEESDEGL